MLLRRIARPLLATVFVVDGVTVFANPGPLAKSEIATRSATAVSTDPVQLVRITAATRVCGGVLLALGKMPRLAALVLAATTVPVTVVEQNFWSEEDPDLRAAKRSAFLKDAGLLGGLLIAAADTEGKPSLGWRGRSAARHAAQTISSTLPLAAGDSSTRDAAARRLHGAATTARSLAERARDEAADLTDIAREQGPHWAEVAKDRAADIGTRLGDLAQESAPLVDTVRDRAVGLTDIAREQGPHWAEIAKDRAADIGTRLSGLAQDSAPLVDTVRDRGAELAETTRRRGGRLIETTRDRGAELGETARHRLNR